MLFATLGAKFVPRAVLCAFGVLCGVCGMIFGKKNRGKANKMRCWVLFFERYVAQ